MPVFVFRGIIPLLFILHFGYSNETTKIEKGEWRKKNSPYFSTELPPIFAFHTKIGKDLEAVLNLLRNNIIIANRYVPAILSPCLGINLKQLLISTNDSFQISLVPFTFLTVLSLLMIFSRNNYPICFFQIFFLI